jgi:xanthine dehydrogenase YagR molybdenum-binding subunit
VSIDTKAAENAPGVLAVLTHRNMPRMKALPWSHLRPQGQTYLPLQDDQIHYAGSQSRSWSPPRSTGRPIPAP